jgi:hypothetical protein
MTGTGPFALMVVLLAVVGLVAVLSNRLAHRVRFPAAALFLVGGAIAATVIPALHGPSQHAVEQVVAVALACILFDGGMNIGWARFRSAVAPIATTGVLGTFLTVLAAALLVHFAFGFAWYVSLLVATAVAPTDPAVVFSVLGQREVSGRAGIILKGEAGANDPVGIALMVSLIAAAGLSAGAFAHAGGEFVVQMAVGVAAGVAGGRVMLWFTRRVPLPSEGLYPLRTLACVLLLFGLVAGRPGLVAKNPSGSQSPAPKRPCARAMPALLSQCSRGNGEHRALGVCHAVTAHPAGEGPCQRATTASAHHQQVTRAAGEAYQDPASRAAFHVRLHQRIIRDFSPHRDERIPQTLAGHVPPDPAQLARRTIPGGGAITLRRQPRDNGQ